MNCYLLFVVYVKICFINDHCSLFTFLCQCHTAGYGLLFPEGVVSFASTGELCVLVELHEGESHGVHDGTQHVHEDVHRMSEEEDEQEDQ